MKNSLISSVRNSVKVLVVVSFLGLTFACEESVEPNVKNVNKGKLETDGPSIPPRPVG